MIINSKQWYTKKNVVNIDRYYRMIMVNLNELECLIRDIVKYQ